MRLAGGELGLGLRDVSARHFADIETVAGLLQRLFEDADVALLNLDDGGVAQIIHIDRGGRQQHRLIEHTQRFARARDLALRGAGFVGGLTAIVQSLRDREAGAARWVDAVGFGSHDLGRGAAGGNVGVGVLNTGGGRERYFRAIAGQRLRHVFVGHPHRGALRVELRIVLIGPHQCSLDRIRQGGRQIRVTYQKDRSRSSGECLHPIHPWYSIRFCLRFEGKNRVPTSLRVSPPTQHRTGGRATEPP